MLVFSAVPALARPTHIFFAPAQPGVEIPPEGVTGRCDDTTSPIDVATCELLHPGHPGGRFVCDIPVIFEENGEPRAKGFLCRIPEHHHHRHHKHHHGGGGGISIGFNQGIG